MTESERIADDTTPSNDTAVTEVVEQPEEKSEAASEPRIVPAAPDMRLIDHTTETRAYWDGDGRYFFEYPAQWQVAETQDKVLMTAVPSNDFVVSIDFHSPGRSINPTTLGYKDTSTGVCQVYIYDAVQSSRPTRGPQEIKIPGADDAAWAAWEWNGNVTEFVIFRVNGDYKKLELQYLSTASPLRAQALIPLKTLRIKNKSPQVAMDPAARNAIPGLPQAGTADEGYVAPSPVGPITRPAAGVSNDKDKAADKTIAAFDIATCNEWTYQETNPVGIGGFRKQDGEKWIEFKNGKQYATFKEMKRTNDAVILFDKVRGIWIRLRKRDAAWSSDSNTWNLMPYATEPANPNQGNVASRTLPPSGVQKSTEKVPDSQRGIIGVVLDDGSANRRSSAEPDGMKLALRALTGDRSPIMGGSRNPLPVNGVRINSLIPSFPADDAGLWFGAIVTKVDGQPVATVAEFVQLTAQKSPGDEVLLRLDGTENDTFCQAELDYRRARLNTVLYDLMMPQQVERCMNMKAGVRVKVVSANSSLSAFTRDEPTNSINEIKARGGAVNEDVFRPGSPVIAVEFEGRQLSDDCFRSLLELRDVTTFRVHHGGFTHETLTGSGIRELRHLPRLRTLHLVDGTVNGVWLRAIRELPNLAALSLSGCKFTPDALASIGTLQQIRTLSLRDTPITDEDLRSIASLTGLQSLDLAGTKITATGLLQLKPLTDLECLDLTGLPVTDESLKHLAGLRKMRFLMLSNTRITDNGLEQCSHLEMLQSLELDFTRFGDNTSGRSSDISLEGARKHLSKLPNLRELSILGRNFNAGDITAMHGPLQSRITTPQSAYGLAYTSPEKLLANLPVENYPKSGRDGTIERNATQKWLDEHAVGKTIKWSAAVNNITIQNTSTNTDNVDVFVGLNQRVGEVLIRPFLEWEPRPRFGNESPIIALGFSDLYNINKHGADYTALACRNVDVEYAKRLRALNGNHVVLRATISKAYCIFNEQKLILWFYLHPDSVGGIDLK